jgi:hypothetical protein
MRINLTPTFISSAARAQQSSQANNSPTVPKKLVLDTDQFTISAKKGKNAHTISNNVTE